MSEQPKFAILSHILPPAWSGQAIVLYRLLEGLSPEQYCLVTVGHTDGNATHRLPGQLKQLDKPLWGWESLAERSGPFAVNLAKWMIVRRAKQIEKILLNEGCRLLVACSGDLLDIPAGALAAKRAGIAFVPYFFDDYLYQWTGWRRGVSQALEQIAMANAAGAIVPNEYLAEEYRRRYGIECQVVRNPVMLQAGIAKAASRTVTVGRKRIVYTGSVYHAHYDAFRNLVQALELEPHLAELHIYTAQSAEELAQHGVGGQNVHICGHVSQEESLSVQHEADILFLPLAFSSDIPQVLRTSAPGKMGEYLASGTPILVHAPADSFLSWFFRKHRCGEVVDTQDVSLLVESSRRLLNRGDEVEKMIAQAQEVAATEFSTGRQSEIFYRYLQTIMGGSLELSLSDTRDR